MLGFSLPPPISIYVSIVCTFDSKHPTTAFEHHETEFVLDYTPFHSQQWPLVFYSV